MWKFTCGENIIKAMYGGGLARMLGRGHTKEIGNCKATVISGKIADFKQATGFRISRRTLRKLLFD
jgi:hypothetical protein